MLTTVKLYGHLAKKFGKIHRFEISSPKEAIQALGANFPAFRAHILKHSQPGYHVLVGDNDLTAEELCLGVTPGKTIKFIPAVVGASGKPGGLNTIIGAVLIVVGYALSFTGWGAAASPFLYKMGAAMMIGGLTQMIAGVPALTGGPAGEERDKNKPSYAYDGPQQTTSQGFPVPICYGMVEVGSAVVSMGIYAEDYWGQNEAEPSSGFRIITPLLSLNEWLEDGVDTVSISVPITIGSALNLPTVTIKEQSPGGHFFLSGGLGAQVFGGTAIPQGIFYADLEATDGVNTVVKKITLYVEVPQSGDGDTGPRFRYD